MTATSPEDPLARQWSTGKRPLVYDFTIRNERFFRLLSRLVWTADVAPFYRELASLRELPAGTAVLDMPCGGGVAFRGLDPATPVRYVAADVSPVMLGRARAVAESRGLRQVELTETSVTDLPFADRAFDLCLCYNGLHCFIDPPAAVAELARVVRPGGELRGTVVVSDAGGPSARAIRFFQRTDQFGKVPAAGDVRQWLAGAGFTDLELHRDGAWLAFHGRRAGG